VGAKLFIRSKTQVTLSLAGKTLRPHAENLLRAVSLARQAVHEQQAGQRFWSSLDCRGPFYQHLFASGYLEKVSIAASRCKGQRAIRKFLTGAENGFGLRSGSGAGTFAAASRGGNAELAG